MLLIATLIVFSIIYSSAYGALSVVTGSEKKADKVIDFLFEVFSLLFYGSIFLAIIYSMLVTWG